MYKASNSNSEKAENLPKQQIPPGTTIVDFRSDTITRPDAEMRRVMAEAAVGDDVFGEDPSVAALQKQAAELLGKEAALFVPSGTMANQIAVMNHCWMRGSEIIAGNKSHIFQYEQGGAATLGGVHTFPVENLPDGTFSLDDLQKAVRADDLHYPVTQLVCIENTHNMMGGKALPLSWLDQLAVLCRKLELPIHLDGARLLNAAVAQRVSPERLTRDCSSVSLCLSKGLGAPVGSVLAGSRDFIQRAVRLRKVMGGGMRQSGILAAAGSLALVRYETTLLADNQLATTIAKRVRAAESSKVTVDEAGVHTNIVMLDCTTSSYSPSHLRNDLEKLDPPNDLVSVKALAVNNTQVRLVTNNTINTQDADLACQKIIKVIS
ncbi:Aromatic amino acid beta-eliminating lyase/threonine aldolase [Trinorchestia longiramus]|nr:Aromatic amino acid beta-eliminating lyase/threonine aldolase [Trinorchestia longiramus]